MYRNTIIVLHGTVFLHIRTSCNLYFDIIDHWEKFQTSKLQRNKLIGVLHITTIVPLTSLSLMSFSHATKTNTAGTQLFILLCGYLLLPFRDIQLYYSFKQLLLFSRVCTS